MNKKLQNYHFNMYRLKIYFLVIIFIFEIYKFSKIIFFILQRNNIYLQKKYLIGFFLNSHTNVL